MRAISSILALLVILAGCADAPADEPPAPAPEPDTAPPAAPAVVVAVIDSAINVYHEHFQRNESIPDDVLAGFVDPDSGEAPKRVNLTRNGTWEERREADAAVWDNVRSGRLHYFEGTRILAVSFGGNIIDGGSHGTGTSGAVLDANPDAIVILVQGVGGSAGEQWAARMPFVDILSESYGLYCGQPVVELVPGDSTAKNNKVAWENGKVVVGAADNTPCPAFNDGTAGPPWVVGVAGDHPDAEGGCREPISGNFPDFTADFTQELPTDRSLDGYRSMSGTSFATPMTAGAYSLALQTVRSAWNHTGGIVDGALAVSPDGARLTHTGLRDAFNQTAVYFGFSTGCEEPVTPVAPWVQMGWGHVDGAVGQAAAAVLLGEPAAPKPDEAVAYMEAQYDYRKTTWAAVT